MRSRSQESASTEAKFSWTESSDKDLQDASSTKLSSASFIRNFWLEQMHAVPNRSTLTSESRMTSDLARILPASASTVESSNRLTSFSVDAILRSSKTSNMGSTTEGYCRWENDRVDPMSKFQSLDLPKRGELSLRRNWKRNASNRFLKALCIQCYDANIHTLLWERTLQVVLRFATDENVFVQTKLFDFIVKQTVKAVNRSEGYIQTDRRLCSKVKASEMYRPIIKKKQSFECYVCIVVRCMKWIQWGYRQSTAQVNPTAYKTIHL